MVAKLEYFLKVAELKSFRKAAEELYITQPALSTSIARLEAELDVKLFDRSNRGIELTEIGRKITDDAKAVCAHYGNILSTVSAYKDGLRQVVNFGTGIRHAVLIVGQYQLQNPSCSMMLSQFSSYNELKRALLDGAIDLCMCAPPVEGDGIDCEVIINEPLCVLMNRSHRFAPRSSLELAELSEEHVLKLPASHPFNLQLARIYKAAGLKEPVCIMHADADANALYISSAHGASCVIIMPVSRCKEFSRSDDRLTYVPLSDRGCFRPIGFSWLKKNPPSRQVEEFLDCARRHYSGENFRI